MLHSLIIIGLTGFPSASPSNLTREQVRAVIERTRQATVEITARRVTGAHRTTSYGAGTIVSSRGVILTCLHVVRGFPSVKITTHDGFEHAADLVFSDVELDLAILRFHAGGRYVGVPMGPQDSIAAGESAIFAGYPTRGRRIMVHARLEGRTSLVRVPAIAAGTKMLRFVGEVDSGFSGGPVVSLEGRLIGVVAARSTKHPGHGYALPARLVFDSLSDQKKGPSPAGVAMYGSMLDDIADPASYLTIEEPSGFEIPPLPPELVGLLPAYN